MPNAAPDVRLTRLPRHTMAHGVIGNRHVYEAGELPDKVVEAIRHSETDPRHDPLDALIQDWAP